MPRDPQTASDWDAEAREQADIAAQINADAPVKSDPQHAGTAVEGDGVVEQPKVTLQIVPDAEVEYPLTLSGWGDEGLFELVFDGASTTHEVSPAVAEQTIHVASVEVAE